MTRLGFALLALHAAPGLGPKRIHRLIAAMGSAQQVVQDPIEAGCTVEPRILRMPDRVYLERLAAEQEMAARACGAAASHPRR